MLAADGNREATDKIMQQYNYGPMAYAIAIALAWVSITASLMINLVLACFFAVPPDVAVRGVPSRGKHNR
jgi:hypothetical protein